MEDDDLEPAAKPESPAAPASSPLALVAAIALVTALGGGAGALLGSWQFDRIEEVAEQRANAEPVKTANALAWDEATAVARLEPVVTNLAQPSGTWIRLDTAMVFDREAVDDVERMKAELSESVLQFARTLSITELQGASAFNHLRDDLNERARMVSAGTVSELIIEAMVIQ